MVYRVLGGIICSLVGWMFMIWAGVLGGSSFDTNFFGDSELVERPVSEVYHALDAIDMDGSRGLEVLDQVPPVRKQAVPGQSISWTIYAGQHPAMTLEARLEPKNEGTATMVHTDLTRHKLPPGQAVTPAFNVPGGFDFVLRMAIADALAPMDSEYASISHEGQIRPITHAAMIDAAERQFAPHLGKGAPDKDEWLKENRRRYDAARSQAANRDPNVRFTPGQPMIDPTVR